tara:strand:- start:410 stop:982 length:573 start_codon:yes stop_codon:yes gene_type:complete
MKYLEVTSYHGTQIVSTADLKTHCRISTSEDDTYLESLESAAVRTLEEYTNLFLLTTTCKQYGNTFKDLNILFKSPAQSESFEVYYRKDSTTTLSFTDEVDLIHLIKPARIELKAGSSTPSTLDTFQAWRAEYKVGYANIASIPKPLIQAIKIMVATMYENRQSVIVGKTVSEIPKTAEYLMNPFKIQTL